MKNIFNIYKILIQFLNSQNKLFCEFKSKKSKKDDCKTKKKLIN